MHKWMMYANVGFNSCLLELEINVQWGLLHNLTNVDTYRSRESKLLPSTWKIVKHVLTKAVEWKCISFYDRMFHLYKLVGIQFLQEIINVHDNEVV